MRTKGLGAIENLSGSYPKETSLELFRRICLNRYFDLKVTELYDPKLFDCPVYLGVGEETITAALSMSFRPERIFGQHRCHGLYLSYGGPINPLIDELLGMSTGCAGGMGGSASIHCPEIGMMGHDGLMGSQIPIAGGYAMATKNKTLAIMGDASAEEDYVLGELAFSATKKPPVLFVCTDNDLSCLTPVCIRRSWNMVSHATFGMPAIEITDDPWLIMHRVASLSNHLPAFVNIQTCRISSHAGTAKDRIKTPEWDRFSLVKKEMHSLGLENDSEKIEESVKLAVNKAWEERLEIKWKTKK